MTPPWSATRPALGTWVKVPAPEVVEILVLTGLDFLVIDGEHGAFDPRTLSTMISVARGHGIPAFVRTAGHAPRDVQPALDAGAAGLFVPHVDSVGIARKVVESCRFPPRGRRGASPNTRAGAWGRIGSKDYLARGEDEVTLVAQLESPEAVADADRITEVAGIDAVFIGAYDLAVSAGVEPGGEAAQALVRGAEDRCQASNRTYGGVAFSGAQAGELLDRGHRFVMVGSDVAFLGGGARETVSEVRG
ncbi:HpcH/HpaI aldolase/citrate lyase family protein [Streptomyces canus]|jgi:2-keto-3-deoxy-L-rhamnonate aldolase RhmA|uniref:HpcH/HpaI aldolase family protein n=1 Tax=Streptomyces canus TaxID=58343 RepID=UPI0036E278BB